MAIGTLAAVALGAGAIGSAAISSGAAGKAANAATEAANASAAVQREQLQAAKTALNPYQQAGLPAVNTINALLGLGGTAGTAGTPATQDFAAYTNSQPDLMADWQRYHSNMTADQYGQYHYNTYGQNEGRQVPMTGGTAGTPGTDGTAAAQAAYEQFKNSTGYQNTMNEAMRGVNSLYAGNGSIKSGAAMKAAQDRAGNIAQSTFGSYLNALGNQQSLGMSAGSALAGVGQNYANSMGNIYGQKADAIGNAALANASNMNSLISGMTSGIFKYGVK